MKKIPAVKAASTPGEPAGRVNGATLAASKGEADNMSAPSVVMLPVSGLELHPAAESVPPMKDDEWAAFLEDVPRVGVQTPLLAVKKGDGHLMLDGRHRLKAARIRFPLGVAGPGGIVAFSIGIGRPTLRAHI